MSDTRETPPSAGGAGAVQGTVLGAFSVPQTTPKGNGPKAHGDPWGAVPEELKRRRQWVVRIAKVPCELRTGKPMKKHTNPKKWTDFATACTHAHRFDGIGFELGDGIAGVDLDHVRDPATGELAPDAAKIIGELDSYAEVSPSGSGVHIFVIGALPGPRNRKGSVELYDGGRFFTVTGHHLAGTPTSVNPRQAELTALYHEVFGTDAAPRKQAPKPTPTALNLTDAELLAKARTARNGAKFMALFDRGDTSAYRHTNKDGTVNDGASEADVALCELLLFWTGGDLARADRLFRTSALIRPKWHDRPDYRDRTFASALTGASSWSGTPTANSEVRLPRGLLDLPTGAGMLAAVLVAFEVIGAGNVRRSDLAAVLGVDVRTVRRWRAQLQQANVQVAQATANFIRLPLGLVLDGELPFAVRWTAVHIAACVGRDGSAQVSEVALAARIGRTDRMVRTHLSALEAAGYLRRDRFRFDRERGRRAVTRYQLQTPPDAQNRTLASCSPERPNRTLTSGGSRCTQGGVEGEAVAVAVPAVAVAVSSETIKPIPAARAHQHQTTDARPGSPRRLPLPIARGRRWTPTTPTTGTTRRRQ